MQFKMSFEIKELGSHLEANTTFEFQFTTPIDASVEFRDRYPNGQGPKLVGSAICIATTAGDLQDEGAKAEISKALLESSDGGWANFKGLGQNRMSELNAAVDLFYVPLHDLMESTTAILRWRLGAPAGPNKPFHESREFLSADGKIWMEIPTVRSASIRMGIPFKRRGASEVTQLGIVDLVEKIGDEPLGHQLFREAWNLLDSNPRSALVVGVAAAEVGLKKLVGSLVPNAAWLVDEVQSPSLGKMLRQYLPKLPVKGRLVGKTIRPPRQLITGLEHAVESRNKVVHASRLPPNRDELEGMLRAVNDFLWICDCYAGHIWSVENISFETISAWEND